MVDKTLEIYVLLDWNEYIGIILSIDLLLLLVTYFEIRLISILWQKLKQNGKIFQKLFCFIFMFSCNHFIFDDNPHNLFIVVEKIVIMSIHKIEHFLLIAPVQI